MERRDKNERSARYTSQILLGGQRKYKSNTREIKRDRERDTHRQTDTQTDTQTNRGKCESF